MLLQAFQILRGHKPEHRALSFLVWEDEMMQAIICLKISTGEMMRSVSLRLGREYCLFVLNGDNADRADVHVRRSMAGRLTRALPQFVDRFSACLLVSTCYD